MKRCLSSAVFVCLTFVAGQAQAQSDLPSYGSTNASAYNTTGSSAYSDIVGEFEPADDWIVQPGGEIENSPNDFSVNLAPPVAPTLQNVRVFSTEASVEPPTDWRRTEAGQLWGRPARRMSDQWYDGDMKLQLGIDYLFFSRGAAADNLFAADTAGTTYSLADIDPGSDTTLRYRFLIATEGGTGFELSAFDFQEFSGSLRLEGEGITPLFFGLIPAEPVESYDASYRSRLKNYQANVWGRRSERFKIGYGVRYVNLDENFDIEFLPDANGGGTSTTANVDGGFSSRTDNKIFGGQLMARIYRPFIDKVYLEAGVDGGYGFNRITADSDTANFDSQTKETTGTGFIGFNGGITFRPTTGLSFRIGYEGLLLTSVALSPDQSTSIDSFNGTGEITTGSLYFGGAYLGAALAF